MPVKCFLIEPIHEKLPSGLPSECWDDRSIIGWVRRDTGEQHQHNSDFGVGAMWFATWYPRNWDWDNESGPHLMVRCPNGPETLTDRGTRDWDIDSRASNCTLAKDRLHRCWIRHGEPPNVTVDKAGLTCKAGAGSIALSNWHGFLRNGELVP